MCRRRRSGYFAVFIAAMVVGWCGSVSARESEAVDRKTGLILPARLGAFERDGQMKYDPAGNPMATFLAGRMILLDLYYYRDNPFATEYANCRDYVKINHPDARLISDGASNLRPSGRRAIFTFPTTFLGGPKIRVNSELIMFPHRDRYIKFRISYPAANADRARREIDLFVRTLKLP